MYSHVPCRDMVTEESRKSVCRVSLGPSHAHGFVEYKILRRNENNKECGGRVSVQSPSGVSTCISTAYLRTRCDEMAAIGLFIAES
jgi:hypothetical protein